MPYPTPLRYPGGKRKLKRELISILTLNSLNECTYVEPFAGGAGLAFSLLLTGNVSSLVLNDIDRSIFAFWRSVLDHTEDLCRLINDTPVTVDEWSKQRAIQVNKKDAPILELGFSTFFLNRTNRSGIITGGILGGWDQKGKYKIDCRYNKDSLIKRIHKIALYSNVIALYNEDAINLITDVISNINERALIFIDPPYYNKGSELYENHYSHDDHVKLARAIKESIQQPWIVTYDNEEEIKNMYAGLRQKLYSLNYTAAKRYAGTEVMIFSNNVQIPEDLFPNAVNI